MCGGIERQGVRMRFRNWEIRGFDRDTAVDFCRKGISPLVSVLLTSRGIGSIDDARALMGDSPVEIHDPFLMADMDKAVARIKTAVEKGERIAIYGDYDVDGMTSCALLALWLRSAGAYYEIYIPGRIGEGYGVSRAALDVLKSRGVELVVTVDCGITAISEAEYARSIGMGLVITDHHECRAELPSADAVLDPKRSDCRYPHKTLAGVGVAFKLVCALEGDPGSREMFRRYGDLVAIGTIADVMPVVGENRELIRRGLQTLNDNPRLGLYKLLSDTFSQRGKVNASTVSFSLSPRLNAAGRMGRAELSVGILLTGDEKEAKRLTAELNQLNDERRKIEAEIYEEAKAMLPESDMTGLIMLAKRGWYQGVTGIVAAKMAELYRLPAVMISIDEDGMGRGSCRSFGKFSIYNALMKCEELLDNYGGHDMAAGVTVAEENIGELRRRLNQYYSEYKESIPAVGLRLDFEVEKPELLTVENIQALESLEPFGSGNPPPSLCIRGAELTAAYPIGSGKHSRLKLEKSGKILDCVHFAMPFDKLGVSEGMLVDVAFEPQINDFRGRNVQLHVLDIRCSNE